jgi:protein gp37
MGENTKVDWCVHSANLWMGCTEVNAGCDHCYAREMTKRFGVNVWGSKPRVYVKSTLTNLDKWNKSAEEVGEHHSVFVGSMMDIFERSKPLVTREGNEFKTVDTGLLRHDFLRLSHQWPNLNFLLLTKRPSNIRDMAPAEWYPPTPPRNIMLGVSVANQKSMVRDVQQLIEASPPFVPLFLSIEPLLEEVTLERYLHPETPIKWVIIGGESGVKARPFHADWAEKLIIECLQNGIPVFMKQVGYDPFWKGKRLRTQSKKGNDIDEWPDTIKIRQYANGEDGKGPLPILE